MNFMRNVMSRGEDGDQHKVSNARKGNSHAHSISYRQEHAASLDIELMYWSNVTEAV
jgi:hypothetical protein